VSRSRFWLFALLGLCASCATFWWSAAPRPTPDHIKVPHAKHAQAKVDCIACHEEIYDAKALAGNFLPPEKKCLECHGEQKQKGNCGFCHADVRHAAPYPTKQPALVMSHAAHIERTKENCAVCHKSLPNPVALADSAPPMSACLDCHSHRAEYNDGRCGGCHLDLTRYALKPVSAFSHQGDFVREHARPARAAPEACAQCHEQTFCADCHASTVATRVEIKFPERVDRDFIHRNDFLGRHSVEAQFEPDTCRRCHGSSFCEGCHRAQNLSTSSPSPRDPHPFGWSFPGSPNFHGPAARRDIVTCAGCHDQGAQSVCVNCHKVGGVGGNPHPPGWQDRHGSSEIGKSSMCLVCHP
jgi:hypothetical protein